MADEIKYINYEEPNLPNVEKTQQEFLYGLQQEKLDLQQEFKNIESIDQAKVSSSDTTPGYLEDKITTQKPFYTSVGASELSLIFKTHHIGFGDGSDGDINLELSGGTYPLTNDVYNFNNVTFYSTTGRGTLITDTRTEPIVINVLGDLTLTNVDIDFSGKYDSYTKKTISNYLGNTLELLGNKGGVGGGGGGGNSGNGGTPTGSCSTGPTTYGTGAGGVGGGGTGGNGIFSGYQGGNIDTAVGDGKPGSSFAGGNGGRGFDAWCGLASEGVGLGATTLGGNGNNGSGAPSGGGGGGGGDGGRGGVPIILNVQGNVNIGSSVINLDGGIGQNGGDGGDGGNGLYSGGYWAGGGGGGGGGGAGGNGGGFYINYGGILSFAPANFQANGGTGGTGGSAGATEGTLPPYPTAASGSTGINGNYFTKKVVNAF